jgi:hypothetical protein
MSAVKASRDFGLKSRTDEFKKLYGCNDLIRLCTLLMNWALHTGQDRFISASLNSAFGECHSEPKAK